MKCGVERLHRALVENVALNIKVVLLEILGRRGSRHLRAARVVCLGAQALAHAVAAELGGRRVKEGGGASRRRRRNDII